MNKGIRYLLLAIVCFCILLHPVVQEYHGHLLFSANDSQNSNSEDAGNGHGNCVGFDLISVEMILLALIIGPSEITFQITFPFLPADQKTAVLRC